MDKNVLFNNIKLIAVPITIQSLLQAVLGLVDQIMIGNLGSASIAGVGLAVKFVSLFTVTISAIVTVAGIMIAQYKGSKSKKGMNDSFFCNLYFMLVIAIAFIFISFCFPEQVMALYSSDPETIDQAVIYLRILTIGFIPQVFTLILSALLRNMEAAKVPMIASAVSVITNTILNYILIFGKFFFPKMNVAGAAWATSISRMIELFIILALFFRIRKSKDIELKVVFSFERNFIRKIICVLAPILLCELLWSLGENVYAMIYGHIGTKACAAMTLTYPIQTIAIGMLSGLSASVGIIVGESLGKGDYDTAYKESKIFIRITVIASFCIALIISLLGGFYVKLFHVGNDIQNITIYILYAYSFVFCAKVVNMVLGGGVLRSGGQTKYIMIIDIIGTWLVGVPLGYITAYVLKLPIYYVYFILSLEEYVRVAMGAYVFKSRRWMKNISETSELEPR